MAKIFRNPLTFVQGTGVIITPNNTPLQGKTTGEQLTIAIGSNVNTDGDTLFGTLISNKEVFTINDSLLTPNGISGSINFNGNLTIGSSFTASMDMSVSNTTTAFKVESELSQSATIFESGSSLFGDTFDDTHNITGSFLTSGSISLTKGHIIKGISNDTSLSGNNTQDLITETAIKSYLDDSDNDALQSYLRKCFAHTGSFVSSTTSSFTAVTASVPTGFTSTTENDFMFFINGQLMEHDGVSIRQAGSSFLLHIDSNSIGYDLTNDDEVVAWGKFNS